MTGMKLRLRDFCHTGSGTTPSRQQARFYEAGTIPWVKSGELRENVIFETEEAVTETALAETSLKIVPRGAILLAMYGATVGRLALLGIEAATNQAICHIVPDSSVADTKYLYYCLESKVPEMLSKAVGGAQPNINQGIVKDLEIPLPPLPEQRRIAAILDKADALRAKRRAALQRLDDLLQAVFLDMFGDPVLNPHQYQPCNLEQLCTRITDGTHQSPKWAEDGVPFLFVSNVVDGQLTFDTKKHISMETYEQLNARCPVEVGDILYTIVGSYGNAAMVETTRPFSFQRHIAHIKPDHTVVDPYFLLAMLQSPVVKRQADTLSRGVAQKTLNLRELKKVQVFNPPIERQVAYRKMRAQLMASRRKQQTMLDNLEILFSALQAMVFSDGL